MSSGAVMLTK